MAANNIGYVLFGLWKQRYFEVTKTRYNGNIHRDSIMLKRVVEDIGEAETREAINYYFQTNTVRPEMNHFLYNYDKILEEKRLRDEDRARREKLRQETLRRMEALDNEF